MNCEGGEGDYKHQEFSHFSEKSVEEVLYCTECVSSILFPQNESNRCAPNTIMGQKAQTLYCQEPLPSSMGKRKPWGVQFCALIPKTVKPRSAVPTAQSACQDVHEARDAIKQFTQIKTFAQLFASTELPFWKRTLPPPPCPRTGLHKLKTKKCYFLPAFPYHKLHNTHHFADNSLNTTKCFHWEQNLWTLNHIEKCTKVGFTSHLFPYKTVYKKQYDISSETHIKPQNCFNFSLSN